MDRAKAVEHLFRAANADPARILQQTVCYDHSRSLTASVAWGYSVQVFKGNVLLPDILAVQKTFVPWEEVAMLRMFLCLAPSIIQGTSANELLFSS